MKIFIPVRKPQQARQGVDAYGLFRAVNFHFFHYERIIA
jgi:hypothetical protein